MDKKGFISLCCDCTRKDGHPHTGILKLHMTRKVKIHKCKNKSACSQPSEEPKHYKECVQPPKQNSAMPLNATWICNHISLFYLFHLLRLGLDSYISLKVEMTYFNFLLSFEFYNHHAHGEYFH